MEKIQARVKRCGVDWRAFRLAREGSNQGFYDRVLRVCQARFKEINEEVSDYERAITGG